MPTPTYLPIVTVENVDQSWVVRCSDASHPDFAVREGIASGIEAGSLAQNHLDSHRVANRIPSEALARLRSGWGAARSDNSRGYLLAIIALYELPSTHAIHSGLRALLSGSESA